MAKPIEIFKSDEQFQKCCKWWQHKLFLDDWFIKFELTTDKLEDEDNDILSGLCTLTFNNKEAKIIIYNSYDNDEDSVIRNISELSLVHELLHLKYEYMAEEEVIDDETVRNFHGYIYHQSLEVMAKSLLMVKYGLDYSYFYGE